MDALRAILKWFEKHPVVSLSGVVIFIAAAYLARVVVNRSDGSLTEPLKKEKIVDAVYGIGTVTATHSFSIKPGVVTTLQDLYVKEGDVVKKGQPLVRIDTIQYRAPFNGVVNFLPFKVGENVFAQLPVLVLTDLLDRYLVVTLEQQGALRVKPGQKAKLNFDSIRSQNYEGVVESVYSYNSNFLARIDVSKLPPEILPDMTADVAIVIQEIPDALVLPVIAFENGYVWVKRGHRLPSREPVNLGVVDGLSAQVVSGNLTEGDRLMVRRKVTP